MRGVLDSRVLRVSEAGASVRAVYPTPSTELAVTVESLWVKFDAER
jgi:hypothetical protein